MFSFVSLFVFGFIFHWGNATSTCSVAQNTDLIYLHMEQLNSLALQQGYHNAIRSPLLCVKGQDEECQGQQCCPHEVGCCLSDRTNYRHVRECGCKEANSKTCTFPPPYAILAKSECTPEGKRTITTCLREKRVAEFLPNKSGLKANNKSYREDDNERNNGEEEENVVEIDASIDTKEFNELEE